MIRCSSVRINNIYWDERNERKKIEDEKKNSLNEIKLLKYKIKTEKNKPNKQTNEQTALMTSTRTTCSRDNVWCGGARVLE